MLDFEPFELKDISCCECIDLESLTLGVIELLKSFMLCFGEAKVVGVESSESGK